MSTARFSGEANAYLKFVEGLAANSEPGKASAQFDELPNGVRALATFLINPATTATPSPFPSELRAPLIRSCC